MAVALLVGCFVFVCAWPTPEERAYDAISKITVQPFDWKEIPAREAWAFLSEELRAQGCTKYGIILDKHALTVDPAEVAAFEKHLQTLDAEAAASYKELYSDVLTAPVDVAITLKLHRAIPASECVRYIAELSGCRYKTHSKGILVYSLRHAPPPDPPAWREELRGWAKLKMRSIWYRFTK
jgi:hypothetical protein